MRQGKLLSQFFSPPPLIYFLVIVNVGSCLSMLGRPIEYACRQVLHLPVHLTQQQEAGYSSVVASHGQGFQTPDKRKIFTKCKIEYKFSILCLDFLRCRVRITTDLSIWTSILILIVITNKQSVLLWMEGIYLTIQNQF